MSTPRRREVQASEPKCVLALDQNKVAARAIIHRPQMEDGLVGTLTRPLELLFPLTKSHLGKPMTSGQVTL